MANNYCNSSSFLPVPKEKIEQAKVILERVVEEIENDPENDYECCYCCAETEGDGVWFHDDGEGFNQEHVERAGRALVEELEIDDVFTCSWAYTCSKPRIDEFGGGAFALQRGKETVWVDAASEALRILNNQSPAAAI